MDLTPDSTEDSEASNHQIPVNVEIKTESDSVCRSQSDLPSVGDSSSPAAKRSRLDDDHGTHPKSAVIPDVNSINPGSIPQRSADNYDYKTKVDGCLLKILVDPGQRVIFPFFEGTVETFCDMVVEECNNECFITDLHGAKYSRSTELSFLTRSFIVQVGDVKNLVSGGIAKPKSGAGDQAESDTYNENFKIISTPKQAVGLMSAIHELVKKGEKKSIHEALNYLNKDRKTVDRFKHIYYLNHQNEEKLNELTNQWKYSQEKGGLQQLDVICRTEIDWVALRQSSDNGEITLFGKCQ